MMRVSDYIIRTLADCGVRHVFLVAGGAAMHLNDSVGSEPRIKYICCHHEQACAMAAEAYAKAGGGIGVVNVTAGPGGINALNGVFGAWTDSVPLLVLSGQAKRELSLSATGIAALRQLGEQEANILDMVRGITKYAALIDDPAQVRFQVEKALHLATSGRPGPCWLDVPIDVQGVSIDESSLRPYVPERVQIDRDAVRRECELVFERLRTAARPVLLYGSGVRCAGAEETLRRVIAKLGIPIVPSRSCHDLIEASDPHLAGYPGVDCDRAGNITVQNADLLLVLGSRLSLRLVSYNWPEFARNAYKIVVDIDRAELEKPVVRPDHAICCDVGVFLEEFCSLLDGTPTHALGHPHWLSWCRARMARYPVVQPRQRCPDGRLNPYHFLEVLFEELDPDDCIVAANGSAYQIPLQVARFLRGQRFIFNNGCMSMGYELPAALGAAMACPARRIICLAGDGSIQMNIQELATLAYRRVPVNVFVLNNNGYLSIRLTQQNFFGRLTGEGPASGLGFPDFVRVAEAYGLAGRRIEGPGFRTAIREFLALPGPALADVMVDPNQAFEPKVASTRLPDGRIVSRPLDDMYPFLDPEEVESNRYREL